MIMMKLKITIKLIYIPEIYIAILCSNELHRLTPND